MVDSIECRRNAEYYFRLSEISRSKKQKRIFEQLAAEWLRLSNLTARQEARNARENRAAAA